MFIDGHTFFVQEVKSESLFPNKKGPLHQTFQVITAVSTLYVSVDNHGKWRFFTETEPPKDVEVIDISTVEKGSTRTVKFLFPGAYLRISAYDNGTVAFSVEAKSCSTKG